MVCSMLKYIKLFYISLASFKASSTVVNDKDGKAVAIHNMIRSSSGLDHRYTFIQNVSYAHCFRDRDAHTWIYKDPSTASRMVSFSSTLTPIKLKYIPVKNASRPTQLPQIKPITRSSRSISRRLYHESDSSSSSDGE